VAKKLLDNLHGFPLYIWLGFAGFGEPIFTAVEGGGDWLLSNHREGGGCF